MKKLTDFEILRKEYDILAKKLDHIERQIDGCAFAYHFGYIEGKLDRIETTQSADTEQIHFIYLTVQGIEKLVEENLRCWCEDANSKLDRIEKLLEKLAYESKESPLSIWLADDTRPDRIQALRTWLGEEMRE